MAFNASKLVVSVDAALNQASVLTARKQLTAAFSTIRGLNVPASDPRQVMSFRAKVDTATGSVNKITASLKEANTQATTFANLLALKGINFASYVAASSAVLQLAGAFSQGVREALRFEKELAVLSQTESSLSTEQLQKYSAELLNISRRYSLSQAKVVELTRVFAQAGQTIEDSVKAANELAKTTLVGTFESVSNTQEALIATMQAFNKTADDTASILNTINVVSKKYAVESDDLVEVIKRTGGAFKAASNEALDSGKELEQLLALFTSVRSFSRESPETIATAFRTIIGRLQRSDTVEYFKNLGIELRDTEGNFVGVYTAINRISDALRSTPTGSAVFSDIVEQIGGVRQISKVIPLLTQTRVAQEALNAALSKTAETDADVAKAKETLAFRIDQVQTKFSALITELTQSTTFKMTANLFIDMSEAAIELARSLKEVIPLLSFVYAGKVFAGIPRAIGRLNSPLGRNSGGPIPGVGNQDTVPAMLTPGEFVIKKSSAQKIGYSNLRRMNATGVQHFMAGGIVEENSPSMQKMGELLQNRLEDIEIIEREKPLKIFAALVSTYHRKYAEAAFEQDEIKKNKIEGEAEAFYERAVSLAETFDVGQKRKVKREIFGLGPTHLLSGPPHIRDVAHEQAKRVSTASRDAWITRLLKLPEEKELKRINREKASQSIAGEKRDYADQRAAELKSFLGREIGSTQPSQHGRLSDSPLGILSSYDDRGAIQERLLPPNVKVLNENIDKPLDKPWSEILATKSSIPISASTPAYQNIRKVVSQIESQTSSEDDLSFFNDKKKTLNENFDEWQDSLEESQFQRMMNTPGGIAAEVARIQSNLSSSLGVKQSDIDNREREINALPVGKIANKKNPEESRNVNFEELRNQILEIAQGRTYQETSEASPLARKPSWRQQELYDRLTRNLEGNVPKATSDITTFEGMKSHLDVLIPFFDKNATESQKQKNQAEKQAAKDLRDKVIRSLGPIKDYLPAYDTFEDISTSILDEMNTAYRVGGSRAGFAQQNKLAREENDFEKLSLDDFLTSRGILPSGGMGGNVQKGASLKQLNKAIFYANQGAFDADTKRKLADFDRTKLGQAGNNSGFIVDLVDDIRKRAEELSQTTEKYEAAKRAGGGELPNQTISDTTTLAQGPLSRNIRRARETKEKDSTLKQQQQVARDEAVLAATPPQPAESPSAASTEPEPAATVAPTAVNADIASTTKLPPRKRRKWTDEEIELARKGARPKLKTEGIDPLTIPIGQRYEKKSANQSLSTGEEKGTISKRKKRTKKDITVVESTTSKTQADNFTPGDCCSKLIAKLEEIRKLIFKLSKTNASQVSSSQPKATTQSNKQVAQEQRERLNSIKQQKTEAKIKAEEAKLAMAQAKAQKLQEKAAVSQTVAAGPAAVNNSSQVAGGQAAFRQLYPSRQTSWTQQYGPPLSIIETIRRQQAAKLNSQALPPNFIGPPTRQQNTARIIGSIKNTSSGRLAQGYDSLNDNMMQYTAALLTTISVLATTQKQYDKNGEALDSWNNKLIDSVAQISLWTAVLSGLPGASLLFDKLDIFGKISKSAKIGSLGGFGAGFKAASRSDGAIDSLALAEKIDSVRYGQGNKEGYLNRKYGPNTVSRIKSGPTGATLSGVRVGSFLRPVVKFGEAVSAAVPAILALVAAGYAVYQFKEYLLDSFYDLKNNKRIREDAVEAGNVEIASQLAEDEVMARKKSSKFISDASKIPGIGPVFGLIDSIDKYNEWANKSTENLVKQTKISAQVQRSGIEMRKSNKTLTSGKNQLFDETLKTIDTSIKAYSDAIKASADIDPKKLSGTSLEIYEQNKKEVEQLGQFLSETKDSLLRTTQEIYASGDSATEEQRAANAKQYMDIETAIRKTKGESGILTKEMQVLLQELKDGQEAAKQNGQLENRIATSTRNIRKRELALIEERSKREYQLGKSLNLLITSADKLESAFSLLENIANPTEATKVSTSSASQLSNLSEIYDIEQIKRDVSSVISAGTEIEKIAGEDVTKALQLKSKIDDVNNYGIDGIVQQVLTLNKASFSQEQDKTGIVEDQKRLFDRKISDFFSGVLSTTELKKLSDDYAKAFEENQGLLSSQNIQDLFTQVIEGRFKASIELIRQKINNTTESLNKFSGGLRQSAQLNERIYQYEIARLQSSQLAENRLREILSGQPLTTDTLRSNTISRQSIILGEDQAMAGNAGALSNEIIQLQKKIAEKEVEIKGRGVNVSLSLLREQDKNKFRLDRLNQALQDQIDSFDELRSATEEIISAEKQRSDQLRAESIEKITKPLEERAQEAKAFAIAQSILAKQQNPKLNDIQKYGMLTAQATTYVNPQMQSQFQLNQQLIISELQKIAESGGAQSAGAKEALDKLSMFSNMFNQGIAQRAMFGSVLTDKQLAQIKKKQPAIADQLDKIFKDFSDQTQSSFGKLTAKGRQAEADYIRLIDEEKEARRSQIDTMKTQSEMFNESLERFSLNVDIARESIKKLTGSLPGAKGESAVDDFFKFLFPVEPEVKGVDVPDKKEAEKFLKQANLFQDGTVKLAMGGQVGNIFKPKGTDTVPAMLTPGEYVLRKSAVDSIGVDNLERINKSGTLYAADGGPVSTVLPSRMHYNPGTGVPIFLPEAKVTRREDSYFSNFSQNPAYWFMRSLQGDSVWEKPMAMTDIEHAVYITEKAQRSLDKIENEKKLNREKTKAALANITKPVSEGGQGKKWGNYEEIARQRGWNINTSFGDSQEKILSETLDKSLKVGSDLNFSSPPPRSSTFPKKRPSIPPVETALTPADLLLKNDKFKKSQTPVPKSKDGNLENTAMTYGALMFPSVMKMAATGMLPEEKKKTILPSRMDYNVGTGVPRFLPEVEVPRKENSDFSNFSQNSAYWFMRSLQGDSVWEKPMAMPEVQRFDYTMERAQRTLDQIEKDKLEARAKTQKTLSGIKFGKPEQITFDKLQEKRLSESLNQSRTRIEELIGKTTKPSAPQEELVPLPKDIPAVLDQKKPEAIKNAVNNVDRLEYLRRPKFSSYGLSSSSRMLRLGKEYFDQNLPKTKQYPATQRSEKDIKSAYLLSLEKARSNKTRSARAKDIRDARKKYNEDMRNFRKSKYSSMNDEKRFMQKYMSSGGFVSSDTVPAMLSPGEFVLTKSATDKIGRGNLDKVNRFAKGGFVTSKGPATGGTPSNQFSMPDFSSLLDGISSFSSSFGAQVDKLIAMPKVFEISLSSMGVNVNLNGAELLAKLPDLMRLTILETIQSQIGVITESVKKNLSGGY